MVPLEGNQKNHPRMPHCCIHQLINPREGKRVLQANLIQISEVHTHMPLENIAPHPALLPPSSTPRMTLHMSWTATPYRAL